MHIVVKQQRERRVSDGGASTYWSCVALVAKRTPISDSSIGLNAS